MHIDGRITIECLTFTTRIPTLAKAILNLHLHKRVDADDTNVTALETSLIMKPLTQSIPYFPTLAYTLTNLTNPNLLTRTLNYFSNLPFLHLFIFQTPPASLFFFLNRMQAQTKKTQVIHQNPQT